MTGVSVFNRSARLGYPLRDSVAVWFGKNFHSSWCNQPPPVARVLQSPLVFPKKKTTTFEMELSDIQINLNVAARPTHRTSARRVSTDRVTTPARAMISATMLSASMLGARIAAVPHRRRAPKTKTTGAGTTNAPRGSRRAVQPRAAATETEAPLGQQIEDALLQAFPSK